MDDRDEVVSGVVFKKDEAGGGSVFMVHSISEPQAETGATFFGGPFFVGSFALGLRVLLSARFPNMVLLVGPRVDAVVDVFSVVTETEDYLNLLLHVLLFLGVASF